MISFKLAKELKDAGFPQKIGAAHYQTQDDSIGYAFKETEDWWGECIYVPNLEELIDACGKGFRELIQIQDYSGYRAIGYRKDNPVVSGSTSEETVALLWLTLNKKV